MPKRSPLRYGHPAKDTTPGRICETPNCDASGEFCAPKSRNELTAQRWFCLEHIREYNANWNYYEGMSDAEVEADVQRDIRWQRPSWQLGTNGGRRSNNDGRAEFFDPLGLFGKMGERWSPNGGTTVPPGPFQTNTEEASALALLKLELPLNEKALKAQYKILVKRHHPDTNNGDKDAEEMFKQIAQAYQTLLSYLSRSSQGLRPAAKR